MQSSSIDLGFWTETHQPQWITIRGQNRDNPAVLIVSGPGVALSPLARYFEVWQKHFTLIQWDQPGAGATFGRMPDLANHLTLAQLAHDGVTIANFVREKFGLQPPVLLGISAGTMVGLHMLQLSPKSFSAYVGCGQFVHWQRQQRLSYVQLVRLAETENKHDWLELLQRIGPPPYHDLETEAALSSLAGSFTEAELQELSQPPSLRSAMELTRQEPFIARGVAYPKDPRAQATAIYGRLRAEIQRFDAWLLPLTYAAPMFFVQGASDNYSVNSEVERFVDQLQAPEKDLELIDGGGHNVIFMRKAVLKFLINHL